MEKYNLVSKDSLLELYITKKLSIKVVAKQLHLSKTTVQKALSFNNIPIRGTGPLDGTKFTKVHRGKISKALQGTTNGINPMTGKSYQWDQREVRCDQCKRKYLTSPHKLKQQHLFCSEKCFFKYRNIHWVGKNSPLYSSIDVICAQCSKIVAVPKNRQSKNKKYFCTQKCHHRWQDDNRLTPEQLKQNRKKNNELVVTEALNHYGNKCNCCGITNGHFLVFDHINGGGGKFRRRTGASGQLRMSYWLKRNNWPVNIQLLCSNCNHAKGDKAKCPCKKDQIKEK